MKLEGNEIISIDDYDILYTFMTVGNALGKGIMQYFKVSLKLKDKQQMPLNTG